MDLRTAQEMILGFVVKHDCTNWTIEFSTSMKGTYAVCKPADRKIVFSVPLILANDAAECRDTALHEIAHALIFDMYPYGVQRIRNGRVVRVKAGHGSEWKAMARALGARPVAVSNTGNSAPARYHGSCACGSEWKRHRRPKPRMACGAKRHPIKWIDTNDWSVLYPVA